MDMANAGHRGDTAPFELADGRMDAKSAALYLGLSVKTLAIWRCNGGGPPYVKAGRIFYFRADLDAWLAARFRTNTGQNGNAPVRSGQAA